MTLIVSLRIPDGIVIAGDSLATMMGNMQAKVQLDVVCPECKHQHRVDAEIGLGNLPSTTFSYAQKVFPFLKEYGVGVFGSGQLAGKTIFFAMREYENELVKEKNQFPEGVSNVANAIGNYLHDLLKKQVEKDGKKLEEMDEKWHPMGFQVVGYDGQDPKTIEVNLGKENTINIYEKSGVTVSGASTMVGMLFDRYKKNPQEQPIYEIFSLQDAIQYAEFLISTTASQQQFSRSIPKVGGQIDVALVTPFDNFQWIKRKKLSSKIGDENEKKV